jgi:genome maintenance exonuclease 1
MKLEKVNLVREHIDNKRYYVCPDNNKVSSVTTILSHTSDKEGLIKWRAFVGENKANEILKNSCAIGTLLHEKIEKYYLGQLKPAGTNYIHQLVDKMFNIMLDNGLSNINEVWGNEIPLYYPAVYAGTADCVGVWKNTPVIIDFKNSRKIKTRTDVCDYALQLAAYAEAFEQIYNTKINHGVILMVSQDLKYSEFFYEFDEFRSVKNQWWNRVEQYYST